VVDVLSFHQGEVELLETHPTSSAWKKRESGPDKRSIQWEGTTTDPGVDHWAQRGMAGCQKMDLSLYSFSPSSSHEAHYTRPFR
jgi:hypothetical protein